MTINKKFIVSVFGILLASTAVVGPHSSWAATIVHSNDVLGDLEPCGCRNNPQGGMVRISNMVKKIEDPFVLKLDSGDLLFPSSETPELLRNQSQLQAGYLLKAMDLLHFDAAVPGERDYSLGFTVFETLRKKSKMQFLAANLKLKNGKEYLKPHAIFTGPQRGPENSKKTIRIGVFALVGKDLTWPKELKVLPSLETARSEVRYFKKNSVDYLVAITHQGYDADLQLAKKVPELDLIIGGHSQSFLQNPVVIGKTRIVQSSFKNQYVGVFPLSNPMDDQKYQLIGLDAGYESPVEMPSEMDRLVKEFKVAIAQLNTQTTAAEAQNFHSDGGEGPGYQTFAQCAQCHLKQFDFWRKTPHFRALTTLKQKNQEKNKECLQCHSVGLGEKNGFLDLTRMGEIRNPDGASGNQAFSSEELHTFLESIGQAKSLDDRVDVKIPTPKTLPMKQALQRLVKVWPTVQCESCHQQRDDHPFSGQYTKNVNTATCLKCHTLERAPSWYRDGKPNQDLIQSNRSKITCPAGQLAEPENEN